MRALPLYLLDDTIEVYAREDYGGRYREFSEPVVMPARVEQRVNMKDNAGRRRRIAYLYVWVTQSERQRSHPHTTRRQVRSGVRKVGDLVGAGLMVMPGPTARMPFELDREELLDEVVDAARDELYAGDRFVWAGKNFEFDVVFDHHSPRGANHWEGHAHEIGPGSE